MIAFGNGHAARRPSWQGGIRARRKLREILELKTADRRRGWFRISARCTHLTPHTREHTGEDTQVLPLKYTPEQRVHACCVHTNKHSDRSDDRYWCGGHAIETRSHCTINNQSRKHTIHAQTIAGTLAGGGGSPSVSMLLMLLERVDKSMQCLSPLTPNDQTVHLLLNNGGMQKKGID